MLADDDPLAKVARDYTVAWDSRSAEAVASFYAEDGGIIINRGEPWAGRSGIARMAEGFYAGPLAHLRRRSSRRLACRLCVDLYRP